MPKRWQEYVDQWRRMNGRSRVKLLQDNWYLKILEERLESWISSPDSISGRIKEIQRESFVCTKTIYNYMWKYGGGLKKKLCYKKRYKKRWSRQWKRPNGYRHISTREEIINLRWRIGDGEIDLVLGLKWKGWLLTLVDRKSKYGLVMKVRNKSIEEINRVLNRMLKSVWIRKKFTTITSDNGSEFFWLRHLEKKLWFEQYYADPYSSRQRWTNEQYNWQIRKIYPKWTDFSKLSSRKIRILQDKLNTKPRKTLWYLTPQEVFFNPNITI